MWTVRAAATWWKKTSVRKQQAWVWWALGHPEDKTGKPKEGKNLINCRTDLAQHKYPIDDSILSYEEEFVSIMLGQEGSIFLCTFELKQKAEARRRALGQKPYVVWPRFEAVIKGSCGNASLGSSGRWFWTWETWDTPLVCSEDFSLVTAE